MLDKYGDIPLT